MKENLVMSDFTKLDYGNRAFSHTEQGKYAFSNALKIKQEGEAEALFVDMSGVDFIIKKGIKPGKEWSGGLDIVKSVLVDSGGGASGGFDLVNGRFVQGDQEQLTEYKANLKHSTLTLEWQKSPYEKLFNSTDKAYTNPKANQFKYKVNHHKMLMDLMVMGDGTGRLATIQGIEGSSTGATITKVPQSNVNRKPLRIDIDSTSMDVVGSIAHLYETLVISFVAASYDENNDGVAELNVETCIPRYVMLGFREANTANSYQYFDAFRVIEVRVLSGSIFVLPGRIASLSQPGGKANPYYTATNLKDVKWCDHSENAANGLQVAPAWGRACDPLIANAAAHAANMNKGFQGLFDPAVAYSVPALRPSIFAFHPGFTVPEQSKARLALGLGWSMTTDLGFINPYWATGIRALLGNMDNTVHGIQRPMVPMFLPTQFDMAGGVFTVDAFIDMITSHTQRNRNKKMATNIIPANPLLYTALIKQFGDSKLISMESKLDFGEGKFPGFTITLFNTKYSIVSCPEMDLNFMPILEARSVNMYGGKIEDVSSSGAQEFLKLHPDYNERINVAQRFKYVSHEYTIDRPRDSAFMKNFTLPV